MNGHKNRLARAVHKILRHNLQNGIIILVSFLSSMNYIDLVKSRDIYSKYLKADEFGSLMQYSKEIHWSNTSITTWVATSFC